MHFTVSGQRFVVTISAASLFVRGRPAKAIIDRVRQRIVISDKLPRHERRRELLHELRHCWIDARGMAADAEGDASLTAEMMDAVLGEYQAQGGDAVLESLNPEPNPNPRAGGALMFVTATCGNCGATVAAGSIANGLPEWSEKVGAWTIDRGICCAVCEKVTTWREVCTAEGEPAGAFLQYPPPRVLNGPAAAQWLREHADQLRMLCVE